MSKYILDTSEARRLATNELHGYMSWMAQTSWLSHDDWEAMEDWWRATDALLPEDGDTLLDDCVVNALLMELSERDWLLREQDGNMLSIDYLFGQALLRALARSKE